MPVPHDLASLQRAYRDWLRQTHPDKGGDASAFVSFNDTWKRIIEKYR